MSLPYNVLPADKTGPGAVEESNRQFLREIIEVAEPLMRSGSLTRQEITVFRDPHGTYDRTTGKCSKTRRVSALYLGGGAGVAVYGVFANTNTIAVYRWITGQPAAQLLTADDRDVLYDVNKVIARQLAAA